GYFIVATWAFYRWVIWVKGKEFMVRWGPVRFFIIAMLLIIMLGLPVKMFLRLAFNVKYIWVTPWFNI
ncbi:MAG: cytochrome C, partial [Candidatus Binatia bacterium]